MIPQKIANKPVPIQPVEPAPIQPVELVTDLTTKEQCRREEDPNLTLLLYRFATSHKST